MAMAQIYILKKKERNMQANVTKDDWVAMFQDIGLSDEKMMDWHRLFETRTGCPLRIFDVHWISQG